MKTQLLNQPKNHVGARQQTNGYTWSLPPVPPKLMGASMSSSRSFRSSMTSVTMAGTGDTHPHPRHSCGEMGPPFAAASPAARTCLGGAREAEVKRVSPSPEWAPGLASMRLLTKQKNAKCAAAEDEHLTGKDLGESSILLRRLSCLSYTLI